MKETLLWLAQAGIMIHLTCAFASLGGLVRRQETVQRLGLLLAAMAGPVTMALCWQAQVLYREEDTVFWGRLMAGDMAQTFRLGSLGIIAGSGLALGALSIGVKNSVFVYPAAIFYASLWYIIYLHPVPHYVPVTPFVDKLIWFVLIVGGSIASLGVFHLMQRFMRWAETPLVVGSVIVTCLSVATVMAQDIATRPINLEPLSPYQRIKDMGCLSCHTIDGIGYADPGGGLESVASRTEDVVLAFMRNPDKETAEELGIRQPATGEMAGVQLTEEEVVLLTEAMVELFDVAPPPVEGPDAEVVQTILENSSCMACHSAAGQGPPDGGLGGAMELGQKYERDVLVRWLMEPTVEVAIELGISEEPMGAMESFALPQDEAEIIADWIYSLEPLEP